MKRGTDVLAYLLRSILAIVTHLGQKSWKVIRIVPGTVPGVFLPSLQIVGNQIFFNVSEYLVDKRHTQSQQTSIGIIFKVTAEYSGWTLTCFSNHCFGFDNVSDIDRYSHLNSTNTKTCVRNVKSVFTSFHLITS